MNLLRKAFQEMTAIKDVKEGRVPRYESTVLKPFTPDSSGTAPIQKFSDKLRDIIINRPINTTMPVRPPPFEVDRGRKMPAVIPSFSYRPLIHHKMAV
jgi:hypothetical protein